MGRRLEWDGRGIRIFLEELQGSEHRLLGLIYTNVVP